MAREEVPSANITVQYDGTLVVKNNPNIKGWFAGTCEFLVQPGSTICGFPRIIVKEYQVGGVVQLTYICTDKPVQHQRILPSV